MTLNEHLDHGYDNATRGKLRNWSLDQFVADLKTTPELLAEAKKKQRDLQSVVAAGRQCDVSKIQLRVLDRAFAALTAA